MKFLSGLNGLKTVYVAQKIIEKSNQEKIEEYEGLGENFPAGGYKKVKLKYDTSKRRIILTTFRNVMAFSKDVITFLVASDVHAGYGETKKVIHADSFNSFEEVLKNGKKHKVDFVLLGGDLFHENNPSRETQLKVTRLLRKYCFHDGELNIEFVSDPSVNFQHSNFPTVNYEDENLNISMPIFTIHGNHDDLSGKGLTALDVFHEAGLINLFGKFNDVDQIEVSPILLRKGETKIAIYGISSQRDDRLSRAFMNENVKFLRPDVEPDSWFSILVLHQNRPRRSHSRSTGAFLPLTYIPRFFDLIIWGHEHESLIGFYIIQPGSTVATSMNREEAVQKHCGVISVRGREFKCKPIKLLTTRQLLIDELILDHTTPMSKAIRSTVRQKNMQDELLIAERVEQLLAEAKNSRGPEQPELPLIRIKVTYAEAWLDIPPINGRRFGARYADRVANATEMIAVRRILPEKPKEPKDPINAVLGETIDEINSVDSMIEKYFSECNFEDKMNVLTEVEIGRSLKEYSNVDSTFTVADRALSESIGRQIADAAAKIYHQVETKNLQVDGLDNNNSFMRQVEKMIAEAKRESNMTVQKRQAQLADNSADGTSALVIDSPMRSIENLKKIVAEEHTSDAGGGRTHQSKVNVLNVPKSGNSRDASPPASKKLAQQSAQPNVPHDDDEVMMVDDHDDFYDDDDIFASPTA